MKKTATRKSARAGHAAAFTLANHPFYLFTQIFWARGREINAGLAEFGLDYQRWRVLAVLNEFPDCTMQLLADTAGVDRTTLAHTVKLMVEERLIIKTQRESDRRSVVLSLTGKGQKVLDAILPSVIATNERCFAGFSTKEIAELMNQLRRILSNLRDDRFPQKS